MIRRSIKFFGQRRKALPRMAAIFCFFQLVLSGCSSRPSEDVPATPPLKPGKPVPQYTYEVVRTWPHDRGAFTEGLFYLNGALYESTGLYGESSVRKVELEAGKVLNKISVPAQFFGEGMAAVNGELFQLTWTNHVCFVYDLATFKAKRQLSYTNEGWGLTTDGQSLIMSDGTAKLRFLDPKTFEVKRMIEVTAGGKPVQYLNELEYIKGEVFANVWMTRYIVRIDPATGGVVGVIDLDGILPKEDRRQDTDVLNGIAYDPANGRLFVTGKHWPKIFEIRLKPKP
jgi:glutamine cyclotransferase